MDSMDSMDSIVWYSMAGMVWYGGLVWIVWIV